MDQSPIQIVEMTPLDRVIEMFKALGLRHLMVTRHGALVRRPYPPPPHFAPRSAPIANSSHFLFPFSLNPSPFLQVGIIKKKDILEHIQIFHRRDLERSGNADGYDQI